MKVINLLIIGESLNFFDFAVTSYLVFALGFYEFNPVLRFIISHFGFLGFIAIKIFCALLIIVLYYLLRRVMKRKRSERLSIVPSCWGISPYVSECCGGIPFVESTDEGTSYYICSICDKPCNIKEKGDS